MARLKVLMLDAPSEDQLLVLHSILSSDRYEVVLSGGKREERSAAMAEADFLMTWETDIDAKTLAAGKNLRLVQKIGFKPCMVDTKAARKLGIPVVTVPSLSLVTVAEHTFLLMLALAKKFLKAYRETLEGLYRSGVKTILTTQDNYVFNWIGLEGFDALYGKILGIVGLGVVGQEVAKRARAFDMEVLYTDVRRLTKLQERRLGVAFVSFDDLLRESDFVSLHLRFYKETEKIMGQREFALMKPTAYFINTARGRLVDEEALYEALKEGKIAGAGLDVFWEEPLPRESRLWKLGNVIITPHVAGIPVAEACEAEARHAATNILKHS